MSGSSRQDDNDTKLLRLWCPSDWIGKGKSYKVVEAAPRKFLDIPPGECTFLPSAALSITAVLRFDLRPSCATSRPEPSESIYRIYATPTY